MTIKHTSGPWRYAVGNGKHRVMVGSASVTTAVSPSGDSGEAKANARLIAAAPEMLAALERCAEEAEHPWSAIDEHNQEGARTVAKIARAAIARAKGEA